MPTGRKPKIVQSANEDRYLAPGTRVRRDANWDGDEKITSEYGVIVHCWLDEGIKAHDCYVAFFGYEFPTTKPEEKPYILRYAAMSLTTLDD